MADIAWRFASAMTPKILSQANAAVLVAVASVLPVSTAFGHETTGIRFPPE